MRLIQTVSAQPRQSISISLEDGSVAEVRLTFLPAIQRWAIGVTWGDFELGQAILCLSPNLLRSWRRIIPFGISCTAADGLDPVQQDDFDSGRVELHVLTAADVDFVEDEVVGAAS